MKKQLSVFMLAARSSIYKVLLLFAGMAILESVLFSITVKNNNYIFLEEIFKDFRLSILYFMFLISLVTLLINAVMGCKSHQEYMIDRFGISKRATVFWWGLYNTFCIFIFNAVQIVLILVLLKNHLESVSYVSGNQTLFLAFYRSSVLHELLPMDNWVSWIKNFLVPVAVGFDISYACCFKRKNGILAAIILTALGVYEVIYPMHSGSYMNFANVSAIVASLLVLVVIIYGLFRKEAYSDEE